MDDWILTNGGKMGTTVMEQQSGKEFWMQLLVSFEIFYFLSFWTRHDTSPPLILLRKHTVLYFHWRNHACCPPMMWHTLVRVPHVCHMYFLNEVSELQTSQGPSKWSVCSSGSRGQFRFPFSIDHLAAPKGLWEKQNQDYTWCKGSPSTLVSTEAEPGWASETLERLLSKPNYRVFQYLEKIIRSFLGRPPLLRAYGWRIDQILTRVRRISWVHERVGLTIPGAGEFAQAVGHGQPATERIAAYFFFFMPDWCWILMFFLNLELTSIVWTLK